MSQCRAARSDVGRVPRQQCLGERIGPYRIGAVVVGFIGVLLVVQPHTSVAASHPNALWGIGLGIFSAFVLHDLKRVRDGLETNYVIATLGVYLSLYNVFQNLLVLLGVFGGRDE